MSDPYRLYYWPGLPGRGEYVRLVLVEADVPWVDVARLPEDQGGGVGAVVRARKGELGGFRPFAPPILEAGGAVIAQWANVCAFVAARHGLVPEGEGRRAEALTLALTVADLVDEVHQTHHPLATGLYYEDQRDAAQVAARHFRDARLPVLLGYFEDVLARAGGEWVLGGARSYVDLALFQTLEGLAYAFPKALAAQRDAIPGLLALRDRVAALPRIAAYLASVDRLPFNEHGIFRRYPELDG